MRKPILARVLLALAAVAAGLAATSLLVPPDSPAWLRARTLIPEVLLVTLLMEWVTDRDEGLIYRFTGHLRSLWDNGAGGLYGAVAAATFVHLEVRTVAAEFTGAESLSAWVEDAVGEAVLGFGLDSIMNLVQASIWFVAWLDNLTLVEMALLGAGCFAAYWLGRWAWPDRDGYDPVVPVSGARAPSG